MSATPNMELLGVDVTNGQGTIVAVHLQFGTLVHADKESAPAIAISFAEGVNCIMFPDRAAYLLFAETLREHVDDTWGASQ